MKKMIKKQSQLEGFSKSRLPEFSQEEINAVKGSLDFLGLNHYTTFLSKHENQSAYGWPTLWKDTQAIDFIDPNWPKSAQPLFHVRKI